MIDVIASNAKLVEDFMAENFPEIRVYPLEGTYLQWLDVSALGFTHVEMREILENANIYLDNGEMFGPLGRGYQRINLACARETVEKMLERFRNAVDSAIAKRESEGAPYHKTLTKGDKLEGFVYESPKKTFCDLENEIKKKTLIVFARKYECELTQKLLSLLKAAYPAVAAMGYSVKVVMQSDVQTLAAPQSKYPFELIADKDAKLYDRYNVFEADSAVSFIAGDKLFESTAGKDANRLINSDWFENHVFADKSDRNLQLCAFIAVDDDMEVKFAHYCRTATDFPDIIKLISSL